MVVDHLAQTELRAGAVFFGGEGEKCPKTSKNVQKPVLFPAVFEAKQGGKPFVKQISNHLLPWPIFQDFSG